MAEPIELNQFAASQGTHFGRELQWTRTGHAGVGSPAVFNEALLGAWERGPRAAPDCVVDPLVLHRAQDG